MIKTIVVSIALLISLPLVAQTSDAQIIRLLEAQGAVSSFQEMAGRLVAQQKEKNKQVDPVFWDRLLAEIEDSAADDLMQRLLPIYREHYTTEELDYLIAFYTSEMGRKIHAKSGIVKQDVSAVGSTWGEEIGTKVYAKIVETDAQYFTMKASGCEAFREGEYLQVYSDGAEILIYRSDTLQSERYRDQMFYYRIMWLDDCRYKLSQLDSEYEVIPDGQDLIFNIYDTIEGGHRAITNVPGTDLYDKSIFYTVINK